MFATVENGGMLCFAGRGHYVLDDGGEGEYGSIIEIWVVFVSEIEMGSSMAFGIRLREIVGVGVYCKNDVPG